MHRSPDSKHLVSLPKLLCLSSAPRSEALSMWTIKNALETFLPQFSSLTIKEFSKVSGLQEDIDWLNNELQAIHVVLLHMSDQENPSEEQKLWRNKQIELMYDMEDAINRFSLIRENRRDSGKDSVAGSSNARDSDDSDDENLPRYTQELVDSTVKTITSCIQRLKDMPRTREIANDIERPKDGNQNHEHQPTKRLKSSMFQTPEEKADLKRELAINAWRADLVAVNEPSERIINMLDFDSPGLTKVVFIVGGGGSGKTTLAGHVLNTVKSGSEFQCSTRVFVTRKPDVNNILIDILVDFGYKQKKLTDLRSWSVHTLQDELAKYVKNRRYFLVVDDIWDSSPWDVIKPALFNNKSGGRIIVTTRMKDVAIKCLSFDSDHIHEIEPLNNNDAKELLLRVFPDRTCSPVLQEPFDKILKKCGGLPLAITTVSGVLRGKVTPGQWNQVYDSLKHANPHSDVDVMRRIISLSYFALPSHLRACLLYFSIFPEDTVIKRKRLICRWSAEGLIHAQDGEDVMEKGKCYFDDLIKSSLIQPEKIKYDGEARACRLYDTIHDYITTKAVEENFVALQFGDKYDRCPHGCKFRRLSVHNSVHNSEEDFSHVRSFTVFGNFAGNPGCRPGDDSPLRVLGLCPAGDSPLRVLDLEDAKIPSDRPISVVEHLHLKYLSLASEYDGAPAGIDRLKYLETLYLRGGAYYLDYKLPSSISNLRRLVRLFIDSYVKLPDSIAGLVALEELKGVYVMEQSIEFLQNLCDLEKLRVLGMNWSYRYYKHDDQVEKCREIARKERFLIISIRELLGKHLQSISADAGEGEIEQPSINRWFGDGTNCAKLLKFCTTELWVSRVPSWMSSELVKNMQKLRLCISKMQQKDLNILGTLPSLLYLFLDHDRRHKQDGQLVITSRSGFKSLTYFCVGICPMKRYLFQPGSMPKLRNLELEFYPSHCDQFDFGIDNLSHVPMIDVTIVYRFNKPKEKKRALKAETAINTAANNLGNNSTIKININGSFS